MWLLKKLTDGTTKYLISEQKCYTVGRKNCDFILNEDASISRKHCSIYIAKESDCPFTVSTATGVWLVDEQSKYGTYLKSNNEWVKIKPNENKKLINGSIIKFGLMENIWSLEFKPLIVCASGITREQKKNIEIILQSIDGFLKNVWTKECSLVIINEITLTVKVVLALINGVPVVTPNYLTKVVEAVKNQMSFPNHENYKPDIKESILDKSLVSLDTKNHRKELFKGKKFIIPSRKQLETLKEVIESAGGSAELFSLTSKWDAFGESNVIMIQLPFNTTGLPEELCRTFKEISAFLKNNYGRRFIPESEIAQAVAYSSIEKFCNPQSTCFTLRIGEKKEINLGPVIVEETPIVTQEKKLSQFGVIPSSATIDSDFSLDTHVESELSICDKQQNSQKSYSERKREHSPYQTDHEFQKKKSKSNPSEKLENPKPLEQNVAERNSKGEGTSNSNKTRQTKSSCITDFFRKQNQAVVEKPVQVVRQSSNEFWDCDNISSKSSKRKISSESDDNCERSSRKKTKLPEMSPQKQKTSDPCIETPRQVVEVFQPGNSNDSVVLPPMKENYFNEDEADDLTGYFGKDVKFQDSVDELNNTIFSLLIISPLFINEDGSLIDPPTVPVNVKRFKKQKILYSDVLDVEDEELSDDDWIEPHSESVCISGDEKTDW